jgi:restriction system protein
MNAGLYKFHADNPKHVVRSQIRRHCEGLVFPSASPNKYFVLVDENRYEPIKDSNLICPHKN